MNGRLPCSNFDINPLTGQSFANEADGSVHVMVYPDEAGRERMICFSTENIEEAKQNMFADWVAHPGKEMDESGHGGGPGQLRFVRFPFDNYNVFLDADGFFGYADIAADPANAGRTLYVHLSPEAQHRIGALHGIFTVSGQHGQLPTEATHRILKVVDEANTVLGQAPWPAVPDPVPVAPPPQRSADDNWLLMSTYLKDANGEVVLVVDEDNSQPPFLYAGKLPESEDEANAILLTEGDEERFRRHASASQALSPYLNNMWFVKTIEAENGYLYNVYRTAEGDAGEEATADIYRRNAQQLEQDTIGSVRFLLENKLLQTEPSPWVYMVDGSPRFVYQIDTICSMPGSPLADVFRPCTRMETITQVVMRPFKFAAETLFSSGLSKYEEAANQTNPFLRFVLFRLAAGITDPAPADAGAWWNAEAEAFKDYLPDNIPVQQKEAIILQGMATRR